MNRFCVAQCEDQSTIFNFRLPYCAQNSCLTKQLLSIQKDSDPWNQFIRLFVNIIISVKLRLYDFIHTDGL